MAAWFFSMLKKDAPTGPFTQPKPEPTTTSSDTSRASTTADAGT